jgi:uncharacterized protein YbjT (DUF2867 family)
MRHLVMGGTGTVGSLVVEGLLKKGESVRVLTRDAGKAKTQPKAPRRSWETWRTPTLTRRSSGTTTTFSS